jgi:hypothetical protein
VSRADAPERIDALQLHWSVDGGRSWHEASTTRSGTATFGATVPGIALQSGASLSLRAVATDAAGNQVDQTVLGIIPVRLAQHAEPHARDRVDQRLTLGRRVVDPPQRERWRRSRS